ncbi:MAG: FKBP-type peptidyl-prolyl cis-trans isomerase [Propionibacteriaceae bacterium]|nr:FKBP-type peptidyl-prolyl cis-trans isomerase [Propionibacteriaceae bacterium]
MKKTLSAAALGAALALALTACSSPVGTTSPSPTTSSPADDTSGTPVVDRDPQGPLPTITFGADGIPTMTTVEADPPTVISVKTLQAGTGAVVGQDDFITVDYAGFLWSDGSEFDSSYAGGEPVSFLLSEFVDGWRYGLAGTKVGDRLLLVVPPDYGYGDLEDETIPAGSTLVFVVEILNAVAITTDALTEATPTGATLPEGLTISGELGQEPTLVFAEGAPEPTEALTIVIAKGAGPAVAETDTLLYHVAGAYWGEESSSSWSGSFEQAEYGGGEETIGQPVGSRLLLVYPADEENEIEAEAIVLDLLGVVPGQ